MRDRSKAIVRLESLGHEIERFYPDDQELSLARNALRTSKSARRFYGALRRAFGCLDDASWDRLRRSAVSKYGETRLGQRKQPFFNLLNEVCGFEYVLRLGATNISFVERASVRTPDIRYRLRGETRHCEVKTIGVSESELLRRFGCNGSARPYADLDASFLKKLDADVLYAQGQLASMGTDGLIYIVVRPDDWTDTHVDNHRRQVHEHLAATRAGNVVVRFDLAGHRHTTANLL